MKQNTPLLSLVIPVYNEEKRIKNITKIYKYLQKKSFKSEVIIVNDGSTDKTSTFLEHAARKIPMQIIAYKKNSGKGFAIKQGMKKASGKYHMYTDIDLSTSTNEIDKLLKHRTRADVLIATRKTIEAEVIVKQSYIRETLGRFFTTLCNTLLSLHFSDFTCGLKLFSSDASHKIFTKTSIDRWAFDAEILYLAHHHGYIIKEIPVVWKNDPNTKVTFPNDIFSTLLELLTIFRRKFTKYYQ